MQSAGLTNPDLTRDRKHLYVFVVTDRESKVPLADRKRFAYSLSIHGIERAGLEGGVRAAEDLVTWAATAPSTRILEPTNSGPTAADVLKNDVLYFVLSEPRRLDPRRRPKGRRVLHALQRRRRRPEPRIPGRGLRNPLYTAAVEPEAQGYAAYLFREKALANDAPFAGALDLHGMLQANVVQLHDDARRRARLRDDRQVGAVSAHRLQGRDQAARVVTAHRTAGVVPRRGPGGHSGRRRAGRVADVRRSVGQHVGHD